MPPLYILTVCTISPTPGSPSRYLMTPLSYFLPSPYPVLVLLRPPILYHFHSIHYHPHTFQTLSDLNPPACLLLFEVQLHYHTSNNTPFQRHISKPRPLPHLTQLTCYPSQTSTTGTTSPTSVLPFCLHTDHSSGLLDSENDVTTFLENTGNHSSNDNVTSHQHCYKTVIFQ